MDATWQRLGDPAGARTVGLNRVRVAPGKLPTPPHSHGASEEIYYVLAGSGPRLAGRRGARGGPAGLRDPPRGPARAHLRRRPRRARLPRLRHAPPDRDRLAASLARDSLRLAVGRRAATTTRGTSRPMPSPSQSAVPRPRPTNIVNVDEVELEQWGEKGVTAPLATRERSDLAGFHWERLNPGQERCGSALPLRGGGDLRHPRRQRRRSTSTPAPLASRAWSDGGDRSSSGPGTSSRGRRARASRTRSSPDPTASRC